MPGTQNQPLQYEQVTYNAPDGAQMGGSTAELIAFYGSTPVTQYASVPAASTWTFTTNTTSTTGFASLADAQAMVAQLSTVVVALKRLGLVA